MTLTVTTREDGSRHYVSPKPHTREAFPAGELAATLLTSPTLADRVSLALDHPYDYEGTGGHRYTGTKRVSFYGTREELAALHAQIGAALGLTTTP